MVAYSLIKINNNYSGTFIHANHFYTFTIIIQFEACINAKLSPTVNSMTVRSLSISLLSSLDFHNNGPGFEGRKIFEGRLLYELEIEVAYKVGSDDPQLKHSHILSHACSLPQAEGS